MTVYLVAGNNLNVLFGFGGGPLSVELPKDINQHKWYISEVVLKEEKPRVGEVLVIRSRDFKRGVVGRVDLSPDKGLRFEDYFLMGARIIKGKYYMKKLRDYVLEESEDSRIVVAKSMIAPAVKGDLEKITEDVRAVIRI